MVADTEGFVAEDTAILERETAPAEPSPAEEQETELKAQDAETERSDEDAETGEEPRLTEAEVNERVALREKEIRSEIEASENARQYAAQWEQSKRAVQADIPQRIGELVRWAAETFEKHGTAEDVQRNLATVVVNDIANRVSQAWFVQEWTAGANHLVQSIAQEYPDWRPSQATTKALSAAVQSADPRQMAAARLAYIQAAVRENEIPKGVEARLQAEREAQKKASRTNELQQTKQRERPASGGGNAAGRFTTMFAADTAFAKGQITSAEAREYRAKYIAGQIPYQ